MKKTRKCEFDSNKFLLTLLSLVVLGIVLMLGFGVFKKLPNTTQYTYAVCCGGETCSDTYYNKNLNKCVLSMCLSMPMINHSQCYYEPANLTGLSGINSSWWNTGYMRKVR